MRHEFTLEYWRDGDWYVGRLVEVPGVFSQGKTLDELDENIQDAYELMATQDRPPAPSRLNGGRWNWRYEAAGPYPGVDGRRMCAPSARQAPRYLPQSGQRAAGAGSLAQGDRGYAVCDHSPATRAGRC